MQKCAYCAALFARVDLEREHVFPRCIYPREDRGLRIQRLTVLACVRCNRGWSDDEVHFKNVLAIAGQPNEAVNAVWQGPTARSFANRDGQRRLRDLAAGLVPPEPAYSEYMIYPARDQRVIRVLKKIVKGLCSHYFGLSPLDDEQIFADVMRFEVPEYLQQKTTYEHREEDVVSYRRSLLDQHDMHSAWLLTFYESRSFVAVVFNRPSELPSNA